MDQHTESVRWSCDSPGRIYSFADVSNSGRTDLRYPYERSDLAQSFVEALGSKRRVLLARQVVLKQRPKLAELGADLGVTRERVRQLEGQASHRARQLLRAQPFAPLAWRALELRRALGVAVPWSDESIQDMVHDASRGITAPQGCTAEELLLWVAGPYVLIDDWLVRIGTTPDSIIDTLRRHIGDRWLFQLQELTEFLQDIGVAWPDLLLPRIPTLRYVGDGWFVRWQGGVADKAEVVLRLTARPMAISELARLIGERHAERSIRNALAADERFIRLRAHTFGLMEWHPDHSSDLS